MGHLWVPVNFLDLYKSLTLELLLFLVGCSKAFFFLTSEFMSLEKLAPKQLNSTLLMCGKMVLASLCPSWHRYPCKVGSEAANNSRRCRNPSLWRMARERNFALRFFFSSLHIRESHSDIPNDVMWTMGRDGRFRTAQRDSSSPLSTSSTRALNTAEGGPPQAPPKSQSPPAGQAPV